VFVIDVCKMQFAAAAVIILSAGCAKHSIIIIEDKNDDDDDDSTDDTEAKVKPRPRTQGAVSSRARGPAVALISVFGADAILPPWDDFGKGPSSN
jgi:hypothetical protein